MRPGDDGRTRSPWTGATPAADELLRWRETSMDPSALPARAADLVDAARDVPDLAHGTLVQIYASVVAGGARRSARRHMPLGLRVAMLAVLLLASIATAEGAMLLWARYVAPVLVVPLPAVERVKTAHVAKPRRRVEAPVVEAMDQHDAPQVPVPEVTVAPVRAPAHPRRVDRLALVEPVAPAPPVVSDAPADPANEAQLLADALRRLRQAHDPRGALALLDQYQQTYPRGVLVSESRSARIEALLKLGDRPGALALLDDRATFTGRLGVEQLLTRAELRASVGRYADALADFDRVVTPSAGMGAGQPDALERALYGRAVTLGHLGRANRARADLEAYQRRFPTGKYAAEVTRLLAGAELPTKGP